MKTIFLVDDNITNLQAGKSALTGSYSVVTIPSAEKMFAMLKNFSPDLILLDVEMPVMDGYQAIKQLKEGDFKAVPVIFLSAHNDEQSEFEGLSLGAVDYITKPFSKPLLLKRIEVHLLVAEQTRELKKYNENLQGIVDEKTKDVYALQSSMIETMAELVECRDDITGGHIERTRCYLQILVESMIEKGLYADAIQNWDMKFLLDSAQLHDVGKIGIPDEILRKNARLTNSEFDVMKTHAAFGVQIIEKIERKTPKSEFLNHAKIFAGAHHEKWDGSGYPNGLKGTEIPLQGRLMAIADVYDALISVRPYKKAFTHEEAVETIVMGKGTHFDPSLVDIFVGTEQRFAKASVNFASKGGDTA